MYILALLFSVLCFQTISANNLANKLSTKELPKEPQKELPKELPKESPTKESRKEPQKRQEIIMIEHWKKDKKKGSQPFIIETEHETATGILSWDFENNIWQFIYENITWEIKDNKLTKTTKDETKTYPCVGFSAFLQNPIEKWPDILEKKHEVCNQDICFLFANYNTRPMIWKYKINPFELLSVAMEDGQERYYQIDFEVTQISESQKK